MSEFITAKLSYDYLRQEYNVKTPQAFFRKFLLNDYLDWLHWDYKKEPLRACTEYWGEKALLVAGRPYYKIWSDFIPAFCATKLTIPTKYFKMPFISWEIRLPTGVIPYHPAREDSASKWVTTIHVVDSNAVRAKYLEDESLQKSITEQSESQMGANSVAIYMNAVSDAGSILTHTLILGDDYETIEDSVKFAEDHFAKTHDRRLHVPTQAMWDQLIRIIITMAGLATSNDNLILPDILAKDDAKLQSDTPEEAVERLHNKAAKRRGEGKGWTVGKRERLFAVSKQRRDGDPTGRELEFSHQRCGHFHRWRTKEGMRTKWIPQLTVRSDLPPDPRGRAGVQIK